MHAVLSGEAEPQQVGAFFLLLRYRGETAEELAGFTAAARSFILDGHGMPHVDIDWPSYADRHRQQPWFVLAALLLAENGYSVLLHGLEGEGVGYAPTRPVLARLGVHLCKSLSEAADAVKRDRIAYVGIEHFNPRLNALLDLRASLGVRTAVNSLARAINPVSAPYQMIGVFHPNFRRLHQEAACLLGQDHAAVFKGGGGEAQRNPLKSLTVGWVDEGSQSEEEWPGMLVGINQDDEANDLRACRVAELWRGEVADVVASTSVVGTTAVALRLLGEADTPMAAQRKAEEMWEGRDRKKFG